MIDVYSWATANGHKIHIMLEECGLPYRVHGIDIERGAQFDPSFLRMSPNSKIPAIVDLDGPDGKPMVLFESGAILIYLAEKTGLLLPRNPRSRYVVLQWLAFELCDIGPSFGQAHHFRHDMPEKIDYAVDHFTNEAGRLCRVMERRLSETAYLGGNSYSIADIAAWPWLRAVPYQGFDIGQDMKEYPHVRRWFRAIALRPAVQRGAAIFAESLGTPAQGVPFIFGNGASRRG